MTRRPELDGVRGVAILLVLVGHGGANHHVGSLAATGVTLFFVLSGYLITGILMAEHKKRGHIRLRTFYLRRLTRLGPPLLVMLVVTGLLMRPGWADWLTAATWTSNYATLVGAVGRGGPYGHTWSLSVEEQFYLVWPVLLLVMVRSRRAAAMAVMLLVGLMAWRFNRYSQGGLDGLLYGYGALETAGSAIVAGCVVALVRTRLSQAWGWVSLGLMAAMTLASVLAGGVMWLVLPMLVTVPAAIFVASAGSLPWLSWRPLTFAGVVSYSMYLWHEPISHLVSGRESAIGISLGAVVGLAAYFEVERPLMRLRDAQATPVAVAAVPVRT